MKERLYRLLAGRVPGIRDRYFRKRQNANRICAFFYLIFLNIRYYLLLEKKLGVPENCPVYEEKKLCAKCAESAFSPRQTPQAFAALLAQFDVISFDVFDTLVLRFFDTPADVFYLVGLRLAYPNFKALRQLAEQKARAQSLKQGKLGEVTLKEIWDVLERMTGIDKQTGMQTEWDCEKQCCFANPYMQKIVQLLKQRGKKLIVTSDMYLKEADIRELLEKCGYAPFDAYFVSSAQNASKHTGTLFANIREVFGKNQRYAHVGDNPHADCRRAKQFGFTPFFYQNVHDAGAPYRPQDMSAVTGSLYRGIVNAKIHSGAAQYSKEYEYGYIYGGLFVTGYCKFIHECAKKTAADKILFLSRDGAVLQKAYCRLFPKAAGRTVYAYWSRLAAVKLTAGHYKQEYFNRFLLHKADGGETVGQALMGMELQKMLPALCRTLRLREQMPLTHKNAQNIQKYLMDHWEEVQACYAGQTQAAKAYYSAILKGCDRALAVDIGWAGSGAVMLNDAVGSLWGLPCRITGVLAGTETAHSAQPDAMETFFLNGQLCSYLYAQDHNRDLWKWHDAGQNHNLYWELLLGAPEGSLIGFYPDSAGRPVCRFKPAPAHAEKIRAIHQGILDFVEDMIAVQRRLCIDIPISGRDAYAPMLLATAQKNRAFMKDLEALLDAEHIV